MHPAQAVRDLAIEAYIFGYPLVTMEMTRRVMTNAAKVEGLRGPMGQFASAREYPTAAFKDVTAPNADTLYSAAWLDLAKEPWILHVPDEHGRYYLMPMLNGWTDVFADPGTRTTGTSAGDFAIVGPGWHGELPPGVEELRSSTNMVWIIGRTYCTGTPEDYAAVHAIQDRVQARPAQRLGQALHAAARHGRSQHRHEDAGARSGRAHGHDELLHAAGHADEGEPALCRGRADPRAAQADRACPRPGLRPFEDRVRTGHPGRAEAGDRADHGTFPIRRRGRERLGVRQARRTLRHQLPPACVRHALRARLQPDG